MLLPGRAIIPKIITNVRSSRIQTQPCGVDLTLKRVKTWTSPGIVDFDNTRRQNASTEEIPFVGGREEDRPSDYLADLRSFQWKEWKEPSSSSSSKLRPDLANPPEDSIILETGSYLVEFNETIDTPPDVMGQIFVRSSLFRSGALLSAGVMDAGYKGAIGALLQVVNPFGLLLLRDARVAQIVFWRMSEAVEGYSGEYQGSKSV